MQSNDLPAPAEAELLQRIRELEAHAAKLEHINHQQALFVRLLESTSDYVAIADTQGRFLYMNLAGRHMVGFEPDQDISQVTIADIVTENIRAKELEHSVLMTIRHGIYQGETILCHQTTGAEIPGSLVLLCNRNSAGEPESFSAIIRDISEQKRIETMLQENLYQSEIIRQQSEDLRELSTPLIPLTENTVIMPLIGAIDTLRTNHIMDTLLHGIAQYRAQMVILDITGVPIVDTQVANGLISAARAAKLLGTQVILTGISPALAQTIVSLGIDLSDLTTMSSLQSGVSYALTA